MNFILFFASFAIGAGLAFLNYLISRYFLLKQPDKFAFVSGIRQIISISYLILLYFSSKWFEWDIKYLLLGGALGLTIPSFFFTAGLLKGQNKNEKEKEDING